MLDLLIPALATLYAAHAVTNTTGPFHIFLRLKQIIPHGGLLTCFICASLWFALLFFWLYTTDVRWLVQWFALAGLAVLAYRWTGGSRGD